MRVDITYCSKYSSLQGYQSQYQCAYIAAVRRQSSHYCVRVPVPPPLAIICRLLPPRPLVCPTAVASCYCRMIRRMYLSMPVLVQLRGRLGRLVRLVLFVDLLVVDVHRDLALPLSAAGLALEIAHRPVGALTPPAAASFFAAALPVAPSERRTARRGPTSLGGGGWRWVAVSLAVAGVSLAGGEGLPEGTTNIHDWTTLDHLAWRTTWTTFMQQ